MSTANVLAMLCKFVGHENDRIAREAILVLIAVLLLLHLRVLFPNRYNTCYWSCKSLA